MENNYIIDIHNFNLSYGALQLFNNFDFKVEKGKSVGIYGPTGTGKTSLLNKIVNDYINKYKIAYVFQDNKLLEDISVKKNIIIPLKNIMQKDKWEEALEKILKLVNLYEKSNEKVSVLSGGEHQRVNIARALSYVMAAPCDILLMDEPFSAQDLENRDNLIHITKQITMEYNVTSVIVSHNKNELEKICDVIIEF